MYKPKLEKDIRCPLEYGLDIFGGKWKSRVICVLAEKETLRYGELRKEMSNITDAVLAATLKELLRDGVIARRQYDEIPPRVEYTLTEKGKTVVPILQSICQWAGIITTKTPGRRCRNAKGATITPDKRTDKKQHDEAPVHWHGRILLPEREATLHCDVKNGP